MAEEEFTEGGDSVKKVELVLRWVLVVVFALAGMSKLHDPHRFADAIAGFRIMPDAYLMFVAIGMPVFELLLSVLIVLPNRALKRISSLGYMLTLGMFTGLLLLTWVRGIAVDCGCFGELFQFGGKWSVPLAILRNAVLLCVSAIVFKRCRAEKSVRQGEPTTSLSR